jgi:hypothetical protein
MRYVKCGDQTPFLPSVTPRRTRSYRIWVNHDHSLMLRVRRQISVENRRASWSFYFCDFASALASVKSVGVGGGSGSAPTGALTTRITVVIARPK